MSVKSFPVTNQAESDPIFAGSIVTVETNSDAVVPSAKLLKTTKDALNTAIGTKEPAITPGTIGQYVRGDKSLGTMDKSAVGLGNVDNTSDANKPISNAQATVNSSVATSLSGKASSSHTHAQSEVTGLVTALASKQDALVSGTNIKTINGNNFLGAGDLVVGSSNSFTAYENLVAGDLVFGVNDSSAFKVRKLIADASYTRNTSVTYAQYSLTRMKGTTGDFVIFNGSSATTYGLRAYSTATNGTITAGTGVTIAMTVGSSQYFDYIWCENRSVFVCVYKFNNSDYRIRTFSVSGTTITLNTEYVLTSTPTTHLKLAYDTATSTLYFVHNNNGTGYITCLPITVNADNTFTQGTITALASLGADNYTADWDSTNNALVYNFHQGGTLYAGYAYYTGLTIGINGYSSLEAYTISNQRRIGMKHLGGGISCAMFVTSTNVCKLYFIKLATRSTTNYADVISTLQLPNSITTSDLYSFDINVTNSLITIHDGNDYNGITYMVKFIGNIGSIVKTVAHNQYESGGAMNYNYVLQDKSQPSRLIYSYSNSVLAVDVNNAFDFFGIAQATITAGASGVIKLKGEKSTIHSGLTPNVKQYIGSNGAITSTFTPHELGKAVSATEIMVGA